MNCTPFESARRSTASRRLCSFLALALLAGAAAACAKGEPSKEQVLSRANEAFAAEHLAEAEKGYREVLRLEPDNAVAQRQLGLLYFDQSQIRQAYPLLNKSAELEPDNTDVKLKLALIHFAVRDYQKARQLARQILEKDPGHQQALVLMVDTSATPNDLQETKSIVEKLKDREKDQATYHLARGAIDLREKDDVHAEAELKTALGLAPKSGAIYAALGNLYLSRQDLTAAAEAFKSAAALSPIRSPIRLRYAAILLRTGATADAKKVVEEVERGAPDYLPSRVFLMSIACTDKLDDDCVARVDNILSQDPLNYDALFQSGIIRLSKGEAAPAIRIFEQLSGMNSQDARARYQLARAYLLYANTALAMEGQKAVESAENRLIEATKLAPQFEQAILLLSELKIRKGNPAAAIDLLLPLIKERPQTAQAQYLLATAYLAQREPDKDKALVVYRKMLELFPKDPQPAYLAGLVLLAQGQQSEARQAFEKALEIFPNFFQVTERLVDLDLASKDYAAALDRVQKQIDRDPKAAQPLALRAKIYFTQTLMADAATRDFTRAEADLQKAIELNPKFEPSYLLLAQVYVASNRQEQAIEKLKAALKNDNNDARALMELGALQQSLNHFAEARDAFEKVLTVAPNAVLPLNNLAVLYSEQPGQIDRAFELATKARQHAPNDPNVADTLGWILYQKGQYRDALQLLQESAAKQPERPNLQYHLGMAYYMLGEEEPARAALKKAADASMNFPEKNDARQRLALLTTQIADSSARTMVDTYLLGRPSDPVALLRRAQIQERDGAIDQAAKTYEKIVNAYPLFASATRRLAIINTQLSPDDPKTFELVAKARDANPDDMEIAKALGVLNYRRNYYPQAAELLKQAVVNRKDDPELLYYLGQTYRQLKQWDECRGTLERALSSNLSPSLAAEGRNALADCSDPRRLALLSSERSPDDPKTFELAKKAHEAYPDDAEVAKTLGILNYRRGDYQQSAVLLKEATAKRKEDPELLYYLGQSYRQLKQRDECKGTLARALEFNLSPALADDAKRALADCSAMPPS